MKSKKLKVCTAAGNIIESPLKPLCRLSEMAATNVHYKIGLLAASIPFEFVPFPPSYCPCLMIIIRYHKARHVSLHKDNNNGTCRKISLQGRDF